MRVEYVVGFDGSSGRTRPGVLADGCALVAVTLETPGTVHVIGYWPDLGEGGQWSPPKPEIVSLITDVLSDRDCVGGFFDTAGGWAEDVARWQAGEGLDSGALRRRRVAHLDLSPNWKKKAWDEWHSAIKSGQVSLPDHPELRAHALSAQNFADGNVNKPSPRQKIDLAAAMAYAIQARIVALGTAPKSRPGKVRVMK